VTVELFGQATVEEFGQGGAVEREAGEAVAVEVFGQARAHLACAVAGFREAAASLRAARAVLSKPVAGLNPGDLQSFAAVADANAAGAEQIEALIARLLRCSVPDCGRKLLASGLCKTHRNQQLRNLRRCSVQDCGRKLQASGLCQTHRKQLRKLGAVKPIRHHRPRRTGTVKLSGLTVTSDCADKVNRYAEESALTPNAAVTNIIEEWAAEEARRAAEQS
jgi:hypothetical protein